MASGETYEGGKLVPETPWSVEQFDLAVQDDDWIDAYLARLDAAVGKAVGERHHTDLFTAKGVIDALRRRRSGEAEDFGRVEPKGRVRFRNERGADITAGLERSLDKPELVRVWMESPTSRVENVMTNAEALGLHTLLQNGFGIGPALTAADLDAHLPAPRDVRDWIKDVQNSEVDDRDASECFKAILAERAKVPPAPSNGVQVEGVFDAIDAHALRGLKAIEEERESIEMDARGDALDRGL